MQLRCKISIIVSIGMILFAHTQGTCGEDHLDEPEHIEIRGSGPEAESGANPGVWLASLKFRS